MKKNIAPSISRTFGGIFSIFILILSLFVQPASASSTRFNPHFKGRIVQPDGRPLNNAGVIFTLRVKSYDLACDIYTETQTVPVVDGFFELALGGGIRTDVGTYQFSQIFITGTDLSSVCPGVITSNDKDMKVQISFDVGTEVVDLDPQTLKAIPYAFNSYNAVNSADSAVLGTLPASEVMRVPGATSANVAASRNLTIANFKVLSGILSGNTVSQAAVGLGRFTSSQATSMVAAGQMTEGQIWYNSSDNLIYYYDGTTSKVLGFLNSIAEGTGVLSTPSSHQVSLSLDVGTNPNQILQVGAGDKLPAVDGSQLTNLNLTNIPGTIPMDKGGTNLSSLGASNQILGMNAAGTGLEYKNVLGTNGVTIIQSVGGLKITNSSALNTVNNVSAASPLSVATGSTTPVVSIFSGVSTGQSIMWDGANWNITKPDYKQVLNTAGLSPWPTVSCAAGEVLVWHSAGDSSVVAARQDAFSCEALTISSTNLTGVFPQASISPLDASKITTGNLALARGGTGLSGITAADANKVLGVSAAGDISELKTLISGSGMTITNSPGDINISGNVTAGTVTNIAAGAGILGGPITMTGTLSLNTAKGSSVSPNQYVQLDATSRLPATNGQNLTNLNPNNLSGVLSFSQGGTGVAALGSGNTVFGMNAAGDTAEFKGIVAGARMTVTNTAGGIQLTPGAGAGTVSTMTGSSVFSVTSGASTPAVSLTNGSATGNTFRWNGSWSDSGPLKYTEIVNNSAASPWPAACTTGTALVWTAATDMFSCQTLSVNEASVSFTSSQAAKTFLAAPTGSAGTPTYRQIASVDASSFALVQGGNSFGAVASIGSQDSQNVAIETNGSPRMYLDNSGRVGIGTVPTASALEVSGQMRFTSTPSTATTTIDWNAGNNQVTTLSCQSFTFQNMRDGGMYTLIVSGAAGGNCQFAQSTPDTLTYASNFKFYPAEATASGITVPAGATSIFHFMRAGNTVFVNWLTGY